MTNLIKAVLAVMAEVKNIDKDKTVGSGAYSYKGVSDQSVKLIIGEAMRKHGLVILPIGVEPTETIDRWQEGDRQKQNVHTTVRTRYLLCHESGESIELQGYGHGVDSQDKSAGKATTYALKYCLLYTFMVATGAIDDADATHSDEVAVPLNGATHSRQFKQNEQDDKPWLNENTKAYDDVLAALQSGNYNWQDIRKKYKISNKIKDSIEAQLK